MKIVIVWTLAVVSLIGSWILGWCGAKAERGRKKRIFALIAGIWGVVGTACMLYLLQLAGQWLLIAKLLFIVGAFLLPLIAVSIALMKREEIAAQAKRTAPLRIAKEPPARKYSGRTIASGVAMVVSSILAVLFAVVGTCLVLITVFGGLSVVLFLLAKRFERVDRQRHGANWESWMNFIDGG